MTAETPDLNELAKHLEAGHEMVRRLCNPAETGQRWIMHIPAQPDHDPDLVIGRGLRAGDLALSQARALVARCERLAAVARAAKRFTDYGNDGAGTLATRNHIDEIDRRFGSLSEALSLLVDGDLADDGGR